MEKIRIKYFSDKIEKLTYIGGKSDWIDLRASADVTLKAGEFKLIPLGIAMELPKGYEAHVIPRSSTYKNFGILQANSMGLIDESYCRRQRSVVFSGTGHERHGDSCQRQNLSVPYYGASAGTGI